VRYGKCSWGESSTGSVAAAPTPEARVKDEPTPHVVADPPRPPSKSDPSLIQSLTPGTFFPQLKPRTAAASPSLPRERTVPLWRTFFLPNVDIVESELCQFDLSEGGFTFGLVYRGHPRTAGGPPVRRWSSFPPFSDQEGRKVIPLA